MHQNESLQNLSYLATVLQAWGRRTARRTRTSNQVGSGLPGDPSGSRRILRLETAGIQSHSHTTWTGFPAGPVKHAPMRTQATTSNGKQWQASKWPPTRVPTTYTGEPICRALPAGFVTRNVVCRCPASSPPPFASLPAPCKYLAASTHLSGPFSPVSVNYSYFLSTFSGLAR